MALETKKITVPAKRSKHESTAEAMTDNDPVLIAATTLTINKKTLTMKERWLVQSITRCFEIEGFSLILDQPCWKKSPAVVLHVVDEGSDKIVL